MQDSAKKSVNWHAGWLGERDANGDLVGDWARKSNAAYKEDLRKAEEEEKARLATREREKEDAARKKAAEANTPAPELSNLPTVEPNLPTKARKYHFSSFSRQKLRNQGI